MSARPDEGMRVWYGQLARALTEAGHELAEVRLEGRAQTAALSPASWLRLRAVRPDAIHYVPYSGLTPSALMRLRFLGAMLPGVERSISILQSGLTGAPWSAAVFPADGAAFSSDHLRKAYSEVSPRRATVRPAVDVDRFGRPLADRQSIQRELGLGDGRPLILHVGHLRQSRNLDVLVELSQAQLGRIVMLASTSTDPDPAVSASLDAAGVEIIRRFVPDVERVYRAADVYVFPVEEALGSIDVPLSVLEAVASGLPVVTTPFGSLPELFDPDPGFVYANPADFPARVAEVLSNRPAQRRSVAEFTHSAMASAMEGVLPRADRNSASAKSPTSLVLCGLDGSGKSTQIEQLTTMLEGEGRQVATVWCRWDPWLARPAIRLLDRLAGGGGGRSGTGSVVGRADQTPAAKRRKHLRSRFLRIGALRQIWRFVIVLDYGLRTATRVRRLGRRTDVLLLDRYWHDVIVDLSVGGKLERPPRLLRLLLPQPDNVVMLDLDPAVALRRKTDTVDLSYLEDRRGLYLELAAQEGATVLDASGDPESITSEIRSLIDGRLRMSNALGAKS